MRPVEFTPFTRLFDRVYSVTIILCLTPAHSHVEGKTINFSIRMERARPQVENRAGQTYRHPFLNSDGSPRNRLMEVSPLDESALVGMLQTDNNKRKPMPEGVGGWVCESCRIETVQGLLCPSASPTRFLAILRIHGEMKGKGFKETQEFRGCQG